MVCGFYVARVGVIDLAALQQQVATAMFTMGGTQLMKQRSLRTSALAVLAALALTAGACGGNDNAEGDDGGASSDVTQLADIDPADVIGFVNDGGEGGTPVQGGTLEFAPFASPRTLDPAKQTDSGVGNAELAAFYDALMRYDYDKDEFVPWQAESLSPNDDNTVWTLKLRDGIKFSDGTPLDSAAVALQMERTQENRPGLYTDGITMETPDDLTVVYTLPSAWADFAYALAVNPGRIPSPAAVEKFGEDYDTNPVGSGPFVLDSWAPGEELVAKANDDYWSDGPYLDELRFVNLSGDQAKLDSLQGDDLGAGFLRDPETVNEAIDSGLPGFNNIFPVGEALIINNGVNSDDTPGHDVRVRQAIAMALDPEILNRDINNGKGLWDIGIVGGISDLDLQVEPTAFDPEGAQELLEEAKADGYDGSIALTCDSTPDREREGLSIQAQLNAVGFDVELDRVPSITDTIRKSQTEGSFEIACYGYSFQVNIPYVGLSDKLGGDNDLGYDNPNMEGLLTAMREADDDESNVAAQDAMQEGFNETQPFVPLASVRELIAWNPEVHGIDVTSYNMPIFNGAWVDG